MHRSAIAFGIAVVLTPAVAGPAGAWNDAGHKTVALLAYRDLPDGIKAKVIDALKAHPHIDQFLNADRPQDVDPNEWIVSRAATWPDFVRPPYTHKPQPADPAKALAHYHKPTWHFIDLPFVPPGQIGIDAAAVQPQPPNAVTTLEKAAANLAGGTLSPEDRAVTLCWLLHLVGDIHQPLHASKLYSDQFPPPEGDRGGNFFFVPNRRHAPNLHHYWDSLLGEDSSFASVDLVVERIRRTARFGRDQFGPELQRQGFADWAAESHAAAIKYAYRNGALKGLNNTDHNPGGHVAPLTETYEGDALEVGFRRGALAGIRLHDQLTKLFPN